MSKDGNGVVGDAPNSATLDERDTRLLEVLEALLEQKLQAAVHELKDELRDTQAELKKVKKRVEGQQDTLSFFDRYSQRAPSCTPVRMDDYLDQELPSAACYELSTELEYRSPFRR